MPSMFVQPQEQLPFAQGVAHALEVAGSNRKELQKAIDFFKNSHDTAGLQAVCLLISESAYVMHVKYARGIQAEEGEKPTILLDATTLTGDYLIRHVQHRLGVHDPSNPNFKHYAWTADVSDEAFTRGVLPYRGQTEAVSNPSLDDCLFDKAKFPILGLNISFEEFHRKIDGYSREYQFANTSHEKEEVLFDLIHFINTTLIMDLAGRHYAPRGPEDMDIVSSLHEKSGRCTDLCHDSLYLLRALGLPALHDRIPLWTKMDDNHTWLTMPLKFKTFAFNGGCIDQNGQAASDYLAAQGFGCASSDAPYGIVVRSDVGGQGPYGKLMRSLLDAHGADWICKNTTLVEYYYLLGTDASPAGQDYYAPLTLHLDGFTPGQLYHLAVFNDGDFNAFLPAKADNKGKLTFEGIQGSHTVYAIVQYADEKTTMASAPFLLEDDGRITPYQYSGHAPAPIDYYSANPPAPYFRALKPNAQYGLFHATEHGWVMDQAVQTDQTGDAKLDLSPGTLYYLRALAPVDPKSHSIMASELNAGERYSLYHFSDGRWERTENQTAQVDGTAQWAGLSPEGVYTFSWWYSSNIRPFTLEKDKIEFH